MTTRIVIVASYMALAASCGGAAMARKSAVQVGAAPTPIAAGPTPATTQIPEQLVIEGFLSVRVDEVSDLVPSLRALVEQGGGRVINEVVTGAETSWEAQVKLRLPPNRVEEVVGFLAKRGEITEKRITATDVSKQLFDQEIALKNLQTTLDRLRQVMAQGGLKVPEILQIEQEMTRLRGQIEQIEGEQRFLKDRVALATLDIALTRKEGAVTVAKAKLYPGARVASLMLFDPGTRERTRMGGGIVVHSLLRAMSMEVDIFEKQRSEDGMTSSNAVIATMGGAAYSDFLGGGRRRVLNPYLGGRLGYGYLDQHKFVVQGELGLELWKHKNAVIDANLRATGLIGKSTDLALVAGAGATFAF